MLLLPNETAAFALALVRAGVLRSRSWALMVRDADHDQARGVRGLLLNVQSRQEAEEVFALSPASDRWGELQCNGMGEPLAALRAWIERLIPLSAIQRQRAIDDFAGVVYSVIEKTDAPRTG